MKKTIITLLTIATICIAGISATAITGYWDPSETYRISEQQPEFELPEEITANPSIFWPICFVIYQIQIIEQEIPIKQPDQPDFIIGPEPLPIIQPPPIIRIPEPIKDSFRIKYEEKQPMESVEQDIIDAIEISPPVWICDLSTETSSE